MYFPAKPIHLKIVSKVYVSNPFNLCIWNQIYFRIDALRDHASEQVSDLQMRFASNRFSVCPPETKVKSSIFHIKTF